MKKEKTYYCECGETDPSNFYKGHVKICKVCRSKETLSKYNKVKVTKDGFYDRFYENLESELEKNKIKLQEIIKDKTIREKITEVLINDVITNSIEKSLNE